MKSGVFGLVDPTTNKIRLVTCSKDTGRAAKKYLGNLEKCVGTPSVYRWLSELQMKGLKAKIKVLEECQENAFSDVKSKWISVLKATGEADFNVNLVGKNK